MLTGRTRYRNAIVKRWSGVESYLVLQVEVEGYFTDPKYWRDARVEDLAELEELKK